MDLILKSKYKWKVKDYYTLKQFSDVMTGKCKICTTWQEVKTKSVANGKKKIIK